MGRGVLTVDVESSPGKVRELLKRFLHKSGYRDHRIILDKEKGNYAIRVVRKVKGKPRGRRRVRSRGSQAPPPRASLPYFFPG